MIKQKLAPGSKCIQAKACAKGELSGLEPAPRLRKGLMLNQAFKACTGNVGEALEER